MATYAVKLRGTTNINNVGVMDSNGQLAVENNGVAIGSVPMYKSGTTTSAADSLAIPLTNLYVAKTTGADAEALTLANGTAGQELIINLVTDGGGDGTLTPTTATGWGTIVFADAGDQAILRYINDTIGWVIVSLSGLAGAPAYTQPA